jgi:SAM-dependent methyltransferase
MGAGTDSVFNGPISKLYESHLVPLIFEPYAADLAARLAGLSSGRVLELAAGTGVVTRALAASLPASVEIVATDLNRPMLDEAAAIGTARPVVWQQADASVLPFPNQSFDVVVCQFGAMFFPGKATAFGEARRVLRPGGVLLFNTWDRIADNEFADVVTDALATIFPGDPPQFLARTPHGYYDTGTIARDVAGAGFDTPAIVTVAARSRASTAMIPAVAYCQGTPLRNEIEARRRPSLQEATDIAAVAIARQFGLGAVDGKIQAHVVRAVAGRHWGIREEPGRC